MNNVANSSLRAVLPSTFPNEKETVFIDLIFTSNVDFPILLHEWLEKTDLQSAAPSILNLLPALQQKVYDHGSVELENATIKGAYKLAWLRNQLLIKSFKEVGHQLSSLKIPFVVSKGVPILLQVYKNYGARLMTDIDIYIAPDYLKQAIEVLLNCGWTPTNTWAPISKMSVTELEQLFGFEITFINEQDSRIDLHFSMKRGFSDENVPFSLTTFTKAGAIEASLGDHCIFPNLERLFIHVVLHGSEDFHTLHSIKWVVDSLKIIKSNQLNWNRLLLDIRELNVEFQMKVVLFYLRNQFNLNYPDVILEFLAQGLDYKTIETYYSVKASPRKKILGKFPSIWKVFRKYEEGSIVDFFTFFKKAYEIDKNRDLLLKITRVLKNY